jgi:hypothetical protein
MAKRTTKSFLYLLVITALFYWKTLFTNQFSLLTEPEGVNQAYAWLAFWIRTIRHGELPLWDSAVYSGRSFLGEMQTAAFDPLHLPFLLLHLNSNGLLSLREYHIFIAIIHLLGCFFFFLMCRELGRSEFASLLAGVFFGLGGIMGELPWPHMLESGIWLPLLFLLLVRGFRATEWRAGLGYGALSGLVFGFSVLAGGFHLVFMQGLVVISFGIHRCFGNLRRAQRSASPHPRRQIAFVTVAALLIGGAAGAIQLLPSIEYGARTLRWFGINSSMSSERIPYLYTDDNRLSPLSFLHLLFPQLSIGPNPGGETWTMYIGLFGLVLILLSLWKNWSNSWVRYFGWLALVAFLYTLGSISIVNGLAYLFVPKLWMVRESSRFIYLVHFALCSLAAYGCDTLFSSEGSPRLLDAIVRFGRWIVAVVLSAALAAGLWQPSGLNHTTGFSILLICLTFLLLNSIRWGNKGRMAQLLIVSLVMIDLYAFSPQPPALASLKRNDGDFLQTLRSGASVCKFLKSLPGIFRVDARLDSTPNFGDAYGVAENKGAGVTFVYDYFKILPNFNLLNEKYILLPASVKDPNPIYEDASWKVYANPTAFPRAWVVHQIAARPTHSDVLDEVARSAVELRKLALVTGEFPQKLDPAPPTGSETVDVTSYRNNKMTLQGRTGGKALLVLSENYYPGWHARVNGSSAPIYQVDGALRGIVVPDGNWKVDLYYSPLTVWIGGILTCFAFLGTLIFVIFNRHYLQQSAIPRNPDLYI